MAAVKKIEKYRLEERTLSLSGQGKTTYDIAEILTQELEGQDAISQRTVARFLKEERQDRAEQTRAVVQDYIKGVVPKDLEALDEVEAWLQEVFRNHERNIARIQARFFAALEKQKRWETARIMELFEESCKEIDTADHDIRTRVNAGMNAVKIVDTKLRFAGILENPEASGAGGVDPVDLEAFRNDLDDIRKEVSGG